MRRLFTVLALVVLALTVSVGTLLAGPKGTELPFKGKATGTSTVATGGPSVFTTTSEGKFIGSHVGKGTYEGGSTQTWGPVDGGNPECDDSVFGAVTGWIEFTAANGDMLHATAQAGSILCEVDPGDLTTYESTIIYEIIWGTGRFYGATGTFTSKSVHTRPDALSGSDDVGTWKGTINYNK